MDAADRYLCGNRALQKARWFRVFLFVSLTLMNLGCDQPRMNTTWGTTDYQYCADQLAKFAQTEMAKPISQRSKDSGILLLDYAISCMSCGRLDPAQKAFYEAILMTNDLTLAEGSGKASLVFDEALKTWQGEAYERAMIELLHGVCLMQQADLDNARVAFDRALVCDRFSKGALVDYDGSPGPGLHQFTANDGCVSRGGSIFQRDFLAAYVLRTLCYVGLARRQLAEQSWKQAVEIYREAVSVAQSNAETKSPMVWTDAEGCYAYPNVYPSPFGRRTDATDAFFGQDLNAIAASNLVLVAAIGNRPKKLKVGANRGQDTNFINDDYYAPIQAVQGVGLRVDGKFCGYMTQCLDLYGQAAGRGPSIKDEAQRRKGKVEDFGRSLENSNNNYAKVLGLIIRAANQEEADIRQWTLLPNSIFIYLAHLEPGTHELVLLPCGENAPDRDYYFIDRSFALTLQQTELNYVHAHAQPLGKHLASRYVRTLSIEIPNSGSTLVFVPEVFNLNVQMLECQAPVTYELLPRHVPTKS